MTIQSETALAVSYTTPTTPVITLLGSNPTMILVGSTYLDSGAMASDSLDGDLSASLHTVISVNPDVAGTYTVTYTVTNSRGNSAIAVRKVMVVSSLNYGASPIISIQGDNPVNLIVGQDYVDTGATAIDNADGVITKYIHTSSDVDTNEVGTYAITYTVTDSYGNSARATRTVIVRGAGEYNSDSGTDYNTQYTYDNGNQYMYDNGDQYVYENGVYYNTRFYHNGVYSYNRHINENNNQYNSDNNNYDNSQDYNYVDTVNGQNVNERCYCTIDIAEKCYCNG